MGFSIRYKVLLITNENVMLTAELKMRSILARNIQRV